MVVHHHSHTSRKKWAHYFWEFFKLSLAVFCGFLAENPHCQLTTENVFNQLNKQKTIADELIKTPSNEYHLK